MEELLFLAGLGGMGILFMIIGGFSPIGVLSTCFKEKFGAPRQSLMMSEAVGVLKLEANPLFRAALGGLERFSHVWVVFVFHKHLEMKWHPVIEPPKLDAPDNIGVFASRSPHRPNAIGLSAVKLERIDFEARGGIEIHLSGVDILDGTPVLDIKPYLPYADSILDANSGWASNEIERYPVEFSETSLEFLSKSGAGGHPRIKNLIEQMLGVDPRPTSQRKTLPILAKETEGVPFAFRVLGVDVHWHVQSGILRVTEIRSIAG